MAKKTETVEEAEIGLTRLRVPAGTGSLGTEGRAYRPDKEGVIEAHSEDVPALLRLGCTVV